jgi:methyltransferase (TIGR00027 family)
MRRAAHQIYDAQPLVFPDPFAVSILGPEYLPEIERTRFKLHKPHSVALRAHMVVRSRYAEDLLARAVSNGVRQYVLLGAGLDTFAYRNPFPHLHVFEVDHPATQQWKRELLSASGTAIPASGIAIPASKITIPSSLTYVPVDFEHQQLATQLTAAGFDSSRPAFFAWLGVVPYLTHAAFRSTLALIASCATGSGIVMDYGQPRSALPHLEQLGHDSLASRVQLAGEPFQLFFTPHQMAAELTGFRNIEDLGATELNARYFTGRTDNLKLLGTAGRIVSAWV